MSSWTAREVVAARYKWIKAANLEAKVRVEDLEKREDPRLEDRLDRVEMSNPKLSQTVREALSKLKPLHREILETDAFSGSIEPDAAVMGRELGAKYGGVPIPAGTIRVYRSRAKQEFAMELKKLGVDLELIRRQK